MKLSVIDTLGPGHIAELVPHIDALGYRRYWATEHHSAEQSASPAIVAALAAGLSERLRVGSAGVLLSLYSPRAVASDFRLLEHLFPGRIDLGVASAVPSEPARGELLEGRPLGRESFAGKVEALAALIRDRRGRAEMNAGAEPVGPVSASAPVLWLCGASEHSARLAGRLGMSYAIHHYELDQMGRPDSGPAAAAAYRAAFAPVGEATARSDAPFAPALAVACYGACAATLSEARSQWDEVFAELASGRSPDGRAWPGVPRPSFLGDPAQCRDGLQAIVDSYRDSYRDSDGDRDGDEVELVVQVLAPTLAARLDAYRLMAEACGLS